VGSRPNPAPHKRCDSDCRRTRCGDGVLQEIERCDDGNTNPNDLCDADCQPRCEPADWPGFDHAERHHEHCYLLSAAPREAAGAGAACSALDPAGALAPPTYPGDACGGPEHAPQRRLMIAAGVDAAWVGPGAEACLALSVDEATAVASVCDVERRFVCRLTFPVRRDD